jgi:teichuronic acid biosynthesis protein TuaE
LKKINLTAFTYLIILFCLIGVNIFKINLGFFQLSIYRILLIFCVLFFYSKITHKTVFQIKSGIDYSYFYFLLFWLVFSILSVFWVKDVLAWAKSLSFLVIGLLSTQIIYTILDEKVKILKAIRLVTIFAFTTYFLAFYEMFSGNYFFVTEGNLEYYQEFSLLHSVTGFREPVTFFGNPNNYSLFLYFAFVFAVLNYRLNQRLFGKLFFLIGAFLSIFLIVCTQSRSGFIGSIIFFFSFLFFLFLKNSVISKIKGIVFFIIIGVILYLTFGDSLDFFRDVITIDLSNNSEDSSDGIRKNLLKNGLLFLNNSYFFGVGIGNIEYYMRYFPKFYTGETTNIHNWWLEILVSSGILVFCTYFLVYFRTCYRMYNRISLIKNRENIVLNMIFLSFFIGLIVSAVGPSSLIESEWFWILMAICFKGASIFDLKLNNV